MNWLSHLWVKTKKIASLYTGTFIFVMFLNQLLFFGLCLNPICLIAAMPHVLLITVVLGTLINKLTKNPSVDKEAAHKNNTRSAKSISSEGVSNNNSAEIPISDRLVNFAESVNEKAVKFEEGAKAFNRRIQQEVLAAELEANKLYASKGKEESKPVRAQSKKDEVVHKKACNENSKSEHIGKYEDPNNHSLFSEEKKVRGLTHHFQNEFHKLKVSKNYELSKLESVERENRLVINPHGDASELLQKKHQRVGLAKAKHQIKSKYKLRESILRRKDAIECANRSAETNARAELVSTTTLCRNNGIKNRNGFFKHLIEIGLIFFENKKYYLTNKGKQFGGMYRENDKNERWIVWSNDALNDVIFNFKLSSLERVNISYLMHITHIANLQGILSKGLLNHNNKAQKVDISNGLVNARRAKKEPIYKYSVHDYVPFYFNVKNAMLFQVQKEFGEEVIILSFRKEIIASPKVIFSRGNASSLSTTFTPDINELAFFNWSKVFSSSWSQNGVIDLELKSIMMSECLVYEKVDINNLYCIYCQNVIVQQRVKNLCEDNKIDIGVVVDSKLFF
ncbi:DUF4433 domain-containing protein [Pseudoalteromonas shioyasakiensis]|uniref:DUF4433 domain-containing protein n=1 Tax=Pseudoalteromonas shioyasakiensis TaxID=1190813 RepID=UPI0021175C11|nr:DUF4433 domain-containing protein [Pseudoalteromonas shioyasakiensis]MCQ8879692.1 DUF4433 domain-containing protein [Pseudoalteromonas shioyasakiensis]